MRAAFISREPVIHQFGGSSMAALNLMEVLVAQGFEVEMLVTSTASRSPRLFWREVLAVPAGVTFSAPGFFGLGWRWQVNPFSPRAWARFFLRLARRSDALAWLAGLVRLFFGKAIVGDAWDLTAAGPREVAAALKLIRETGAEIVFVNYAFWAPLLAAPEIASLRKVILMHDMLSARVRRFQQAGLELDCIAITREEEIGWLNTADLVLAIQDAEAEEIRPLLTTEVLVQPIVLPIAEQSGAGSEDANRCLFVGTRIQPNQTGIQWFLDEVWPLVRSRNPEASLVIAGSVCEVLSGMPEGVALAGVVPSLEAEFRDLVSHIDRKSVV